MLVDTLAERLQVVKVETVGYTPPKVELAVARKETVARLTEAEYDTLNHTVVEMTEVNILAHMLPL